MLRWFVMPQINVVHYVLIHKNNNKKHENIDYIQNKNGFNANYVV